MHLGRTLRPLQTGEETLLYSGLCNIRNSEAMGRMSWALLQNNLYFYRLYFLFCLYSFASALPNSMCHLLGPPSHHFDICFLLAAGWLLSELSRGKDALYYLVDLRWNYPEPSRFWTWTWRSSYSKPDRWSFILKCTLACAYNSICYEGT